MYISRHSHLLTMWAGGPKLVTWVCGKVYDLQINILWSSGPWQAEVFGVVGDADDLVASSAFL